MTESNAQIRRAVFLVAVLNLAYFGIEFAVALRIGSVSLFADSIDFLEDAMVNGIILFALGWTAINRARVGMGLAGMLMIPAIATLWTVIAKFQDGTPPDAFTLTITGIGALAINLSCAFILARVRMDGGSLTKAAFLSARNDAFANVAIIIAGAVTATVWESVWPDIVVGLGIAAMNADAAREVWEAARKEKADAKAQS